MGKDEKKCRAVQGEASHHLAMWHRWGLAIRRQLIGLGEPRCWSVAPGTFGKAAPLEMEKKDSPPPSPYLPSPSLLHPLSSFSPLSFLRPLHQYVDLKCLQWKFGRIFICRVREDAIRQDGRQWPDATRVTVGTKSTHKQTSRRAHCAHIHSISHHQWVVIKNAFRYISLWVNWSQGWAH